MKKIAHLAGIAGLLALGACAQLPSASDITTGSILPALPAASSLVPSLGSGTGPRKPERVSGNLYRIDASDRKFDDTIQRENYGLLRAAESAKEVGGTHFIAVNSSEGAVPGNAAASQGTSLIRIFRLDPDMTPSMGAISVNEIIHFFGPTFRPAAAQVSPPAGPG